MPKIITVIFGRNVISLIDSCIEEDDRRIYNVLIDGETREPMRLQRFFIPSIGLYDGGCFAVWCGVSLVFSSIDDRPYRLVDFPEPIYAVYRVRRGWCVVGELSIFMLDEELVIVGRRMHDEIIVGSSWIDSRLVLRDFNEVRLLLPIDEESLTLGEFTTQ